MFCTTPGACVRYRAGILSLRSQSKLPAAVFITNFIIITFCIILCSFCPCLRRLVSLMDGGVWEVHWVWTIREIVNANPWLSCDFSLEMIEAFWLGYSVLLGNSAPCFLSFLIDLRFHYLIGFIDYSQILPFELILICLW